MPIYVKIKFASFSRWSLCFPGVVAQQSEIWFLDRSLCWHFMTATFTSYYRLMITHLGLPEWQYAFTPYGPSPQAKVAKCLITSNLITPCVVTYLHKEYFFFPSTSETGNLQTKVYLLLCIECQMFLGKQITLQEYFLLKEVIGFLQFLCSVPTVTLSTTGYCTGLFFFFLSLHNNKQYFKLSVSCSLYYSSGHRCTSRWLSAVSSAWLILLEIPISTSWIRQGPSKAKPRYPSPRRSNRPRAAWGALPRAKAAQEDTLGQSGEKVPIRGKHFIQLHCLHKQHLSEEQSAFLSLAGLCVLAARRSMRACCPKLSLECRMPK